MSLNKSYLDVKDVKDVKGFQETYRLECPVCLDPLTKSPIFQCYNGHLYCSDCEPKLFYCAECRVDLRPKSKNLALARLVEALPKSCKFAKHGCNVAEAVAKKKIDHEKQCPYRTVTCPYQFFCKQEVTFKDVNIHVQGHNPEISSNESKKRVVKKLEENYFNWKKVNWHSSCIQLDDMFFSDIVYRDESKTWHFWFYMTGSEEKTKDYFYTIEFRAVGMPSNAPILAYRNHVVSIDVPYEEVINSGNCLSLADSVVKKQLWNEEKKNFEFWVQIEKMEEVDK